MNRSMEVHSLLNKKGFCIRSFGIGPKVKLPGPVHDRPNCYDFGVTYDHIYQDLKLKDEKFYTHNGLLHMLDRNKRIKASPELFLSAKEKFDILVTCEERVYDQVTEILDSRRSRTCSLVHVINVNIQDSHEEATLGAFLVLDLVNRLSESDDLDDEIVDIIAEFEHKNDCVVLHSAFFY
ncbi:hypothetical protein R5R35_012341 [Gryllus longicercus]